MTTNETERRGLRLHAPRAGGAGALRREHLPGLLRGLRHGLAVSGRWNGFRCLSMCGWRHGSTPDLFFLSCFPSFLLSSFLSFFPSCMCVYQPPPPSPRLHPAPMLSFLHVCMCNPPSHPPITPMSRHNRTALCSEAARFSAATLHHGAFNVTEYKRYVWVAGWRGGGRCFCYSRARCVCMLAYVCVSR